jgi:hypothetical protein
MQFCCSIFEASLFFHLSAIDLGIIERLQMFKFHQGCSNFDQQQSPYELSGEETTQISIFIPLNLLCLVDFSSLIKTFHVAVSIC